MFTKIFQNNQYFIKQQSLKYVYRKFSKHVKKKRKSSATYSESDVDILPYDHNQIFNKKLCSRLKHSGHMYIKDIADAENIASYLCSDWKDGYIFEANPGPGTLSKAILDNGVSHLRVFEKHEEFLPLLKDLSQLHPNLEIIPDDIIFLPNIEARLFGNDQNAFDSFFKDIPEMDWQKGVPLRFFSIISSKKSITFFRYILATLLSKASFFSFGRCEFFLLLTEAEYSYMIAKPKENLSKYRWTTVLYHLFFEIEHLQEYASGILHPLPSRAKKNQCFHLVKIIPRLDMFSSIVNGNKLPDFYFFVRRHFMKRTALVIPTLEGWIPSCGPKLIKEGMHVFTKFGDLSPEQILMLFNQFSSWPEYEDSSFCSAQKAYFSKSSFTYEEDNDM